MAVAATTTRLLASNSQPAALSHRLLPMFAPAPSGSRLPSAAGVNRAQQTVAEAGQAAATLHRSLEGDMDDISAGSDDLFGAGRSELLGDGEILSPGAADFLASGQWRGLLQQADRASMMAELYGVGDDEDDDDIEGAGEAMDDDDDEMELV